MVTGTESATKVPLDNIRANPYQPVTRLEVDEETAKRFGLSILEHGLIMTPVARQVTKFIPRLTEIIYEMGDGWLRLSGFRWLVANGHPEYSKMPLVVRELTDRQMADMVMEANSVRKDLNPIETAQLYKRYLEDFDITQADLAKAHNCTQGAIANTIRLLELPADIQGKIISQEISETHGRQLLRLNYKPELQQKVLGRSIESGYSVNELSNQIQGEIYRESENLDPEDYPKPGFDTADCEKCSNRQKIGTPYNSDRKRLRCMDKACYKQKTEQAEKDRIAAIKAEISEAKKEAGEKKKDGVLDLSKFTWRDYQELESYKKIDNPGQCNTCPHRAVGRTYAGGSIKKVCIDVKCFQAKEKALQNKEAARVKEAEKQLTERVKSACANLRDESTPFGLIVGYLLGHCRKDTRERFARMYELKEPEVARWFAVNISANEAQVIERTVALVMTLERYDGEKGVFQKMLADLEGTSAEMDKALDAHRAKHCVGCADDNDNRTCKHLLQRYGNGWHDRCYHKTAKQEEAEVEQLQTPEEPEKVTNATQKVYRVNLRNTAQWWEGAAPSAQEACEQAGWMIGNCFVEIKEEPALMSNAEFAARANAKPWPPEGIPAGVRLAEDVPDAECKGCKLDTEDHTVNLSFPVADKSASDGVAYLKVCVKDWRALVAKEVKPVPEPAPAPTPEPCSYQKDGKCSTTNRNCPDYYRGKCRRGK